MNTAATQPVPGYGPQGRARQMLAEPWLLVSALLLAGIGLTMVYSASSALAGKRYMDSAHLFRAQVFHLSMGLAVMAVLARMDYERLRGLVYPVLAAVFLALVLVLIPGVGHRAGGAARWLRLGFFSVQPAELAKLALVLFLARWLADNQHRAKSFFMVFVPCMGMAAALTLPVLMEPDLGMSITIMMLAAGMLFVAGTRAVYLLGLLTASMAPLYYLVTKVDYRLGRMMVFMDPWRDPNAAGFQIIHSFYALGSGGLTGLGLGGSRQKLFYLPEPHTDFILSVLGEEFGLLGILVVLGLFMLLIWRGVRTALDARDLFGTYLAAGATMIVGVQAFVNAAVVMGLLPTKGLTLPFMSYGGSSLVANLACVGVLLSVARHRGRNA